MMMYCYVMPRIEPPLVEYKGDVGNLQRISSILVYFDGIEPNRTEYEGIPPYTHRPHNESIICVHRLPNTCTELNRHEKPFKSN